MPKSKKAGKAPAARAAAGKGAEGHTIEKGIEQFGEEVRRLGERFGDRAEARGKEWESWFRSTFGLAGPFISGVCGILMLALLTWVVGLISVFVGSGFLSNIQLFLLANLGLIFLFMLFFSYSSYLAKSNPRAFLLVSPVSIAVKVAICIWFVANALRIVNLSLMNDSLTLAASALDAATYPLLAVILIVGYLVVLARLGKCGPEKKQAKGTQRVQPEPRGRTASGGGVRRLYRSGRERVLGGVCGGIADYLGLDPVIVRVLFVLIALAYGIGIPLYIILWIIMPRNPRDKWD